MPSSSDNVGYGVQGKFKSDKDNKRKEIVNKDDIIQSDDKKVLQDIVTKVESNINSLSDLNEYLKSYSKINNEALDAIIAKLKRFKEAIVIEVKPNIN